ncbi:acyltransferase domain-containing protein [Kitasatospora sp. NPDC004240]
MEAWTLPAADELPAELAELGVPFEEVNDLLALRNRLTRDTALRAAFDEAVTAEAAAVGTLGRPSALPAGWPPDGLDEREARQLATLLFVALAPRTRALHRTRGIAPEVTRHTLADLGRQMAAGRRRDGDAGLRNPSWMRHVFRGELYQLGRLQFERRRLTGTEAAALADAGFGGFGGWSLAVHIPGFHGPLDPAACDRAFALARGFFTRHYPEEPYGTFCIHSWLLDPQLARYLPADSNILRFQRRFTPLRPLGEPEDDNPLAFVFRDPDLPLEEQPRDTVLRRAIAGHLRDGGHWHVAAGWCPLAVDG